MNVQLKKGVLEMCVLALLSKSDYYGYMLVQSVSESIDISGGTIYPLLRRLRKEEYLDSYIVESEEGPARKYYRITEKGIENKDLLLLEWQRLVKGVTTLVGMEVKA